MSSVFLPGVSYRWYISSRPFSRHIFVIRRILQDRRGSWYWYRPMHVPVTDCIHISDGGELQDGFRILEEGTPPTIEVGNLYLSTLGRIFAVISYEKETGLFFGECGGRKYAIEKDGVLLGAKAYECLSVKLAKTPSAT